MRVVVTGAHRGIGREFARQLVARGNTVEAAVRDPAHAGLDDLARNGGVLRVHTCDVASEQSVQAFARRLDSGPIDLLVNNAGVMGKLESLDELDLADVAQTIEVNALGPLRVTRALLPLLRRGTTRKIASLSSGMGSIEQNTSGGAYAYRMSKAALDMATRSMSIDLSSEGFICVVLDPGWVQTDMGGRGAPLPVAESVRSMLTVIEALDHSDNGSFLDRHGQPIPW